MSNKFENVWDALADSHGEAENMKMRSAYMIAIRDFADETNESQVNIATRLGITQPRLNDLLNGKINKFSLDMLVNLAAEAGLKTTVKIKAA